MQGAKKTCFLHFKHKYLAIHMTKVSKKIFTHFHTTLMQDPTLRYAKQIDFTIFCSL